jgi:hypothetical protein
MSKPILVGYDPRRADYAPVDVAVPLTESAPYDLVVDNGDGLHRVQSRFAGTRDVDLRRVHSNSSGYAVKRVPPNSYDWLYVLRPGGAQHLIRECHAGRRSITPTAEHFIGGVAESG